MRIGLALAIVATLFSCTTEAAASRAKHRSGRPQAEARNARADQPRATHHPSRLPGVEATRDYSLPAYEPTNVLGDPQTKAERQYRDYPYDPGNGWTFPFGRPP